MAFLFVYQLRPFALPTLLACALTCGVKCVLLSIAIGDVSAVDRDGNELRGQRKEACHNQQSKLTAAPQPEGSPKGDEEQYKPGSFPTNPFITTQRHTFWDYPLIRTQRYMFWDCLRANQLVWHDNRPALVVPPELHLHHPYYKEARPPADSTSWVMRCGKCHKADRPTPDNRKYIHRLAQQTGLLDRVSSGCVRVGRQGVSA